MLNKKSLGSFFPGLVKKKSLVFFKFLKYFDSFTFCTAELPVFEYNSKLLL